MLSLCRSFTVHFTFQLHFGSCKARVCRSATNIHTLIQSFANDLVQIPRNLCRFVYIKYAHMLSERETFAYYHFNGFLLLGRGCFIAMLMPIFLCMSFDAFVMQKNIRAPHTHISILRNSSNRFFSSFFPSLLRSNGFAVNYVENVVQM